MFTKVYKEEDVRLRGCSYNVASVYFHLKNKRDYFKSKNNGSCYDLTSHISKNTGMCEKTIKRAIATLRELGLISTVLKGKVNHYSFPILDAIENNTPIEEVVKDIPSKPKKKQIEPEPYMEQNIEDNNKENDIEDMGNLLVFDETTGQYKYPSKTKEQIKEKVLEKNLPTVKVAATAQTPEELAIPSFQDFLKKTAHTINDIIEDFKAGGIRATVQAPTNLKDFLNTKLGKFYKEEIEEYIKARVNTPVEEPAEFISDEDKYGNDVMDFIDDNPEILEALKATVDYCKYNEKDKELAATNANKKINSIVAGVGKNNSDFITRLEMFCKDYSISYDESKMNKLNEIKDVA